MKRKKWWKQQRTAGNKGWRGGGGQRGGTGEGGGKSELVEENVEYTEINVQCLFSKIYIFIVRYYCFFFSFLILFYILLQIVSELLIFAFFTPHSYFCNSFFCYQLKLNLKKKKKLLTFSCLFPFFFLQFFIQLLRNFLLSFFFVVAVSVHWMSLIH